MDNNKREHDELAEGSLPSKDILPVLQGWDYESSTVNVRKIRGLDGRAKLQMRLDLGLLQMEIAGRPDGRRPHGCESLLEYFEESLSEHKSRNGTELGFYLTGEQCQALREEAVMYYHRYLGLFVLEDFSGVVRDTARNLRVLDLCGKFASEEHDRLMLEQFRAYIIMMNTRAAASILQKEGKFTEALDAVKRGLAEIKRFFARFGQDAAYSQSHEVQVLKSFAREIRKHVPVAPKVRLESRLQRALAREDYEEAARLRDQIKLLA
jgi:tetratricopeptide (TPR) repeat protein